MSSIGSGIRADYVPTKSFVRESPASRENFVRDRYVRDYVWDDTGVAHSHER